LQRLTPPMNAVAIARMRSVFLIVGLCAGLLGRTSIQNAPVNQPGSSAGLAGKVHLNFEERPAEDDDLIGLSFSGGGTRAAAFSFGVLTEMAHTPVPGASA
jgi:NTE family protein